MRVSLKSVLIMLTVVIFCGVNHAGTVDTFSADYVSLDASGKVEGTGKMYCLPGMMRMEMPMPADSPMGNMIVIYLEETKTMYTLFPKGKVYTSQVVEDESMMKSIGQLSDKTKEEKLGSETVSGYKCDKIRTEIVHEMMGQEMRTKSTIWRCDEFDFPLRAQGEDGNMTELRNITLEKPSKDLFNVPADWKKAGSIMEAMTMMMGKGR